MIITSRWLFCAFAAAVGDGSMRDAEETHPEETNAFLRWYAGIETTYLRVSLSVSVRPRSPTVRMRLWYSFQGQVYVC